MIPGLEAIQSLTSGASQASRTAAPAQGEGIGASFGTMLDGTVDKLNHAEAVSMQALQGNADTREVVDAVMTAQQTLQTAIAIRDKIVSAYLDISRMSI